MCGIAAIAIGRRARNLIPYNKLQDLVSVIMEELEYRGLDASGIAIINEPTEAQSIVFKKPLRASRFAPRPRFKEVVSGIGPQTNFILLHARATTAGNTTNNFNNHPIIVPGCVGIHNGTLWNDIELFKKHEEDFPRLGEVDSAVIFQLYKMYANRGMPPKEAIQAVSRELAGAFTGALVDWNHPHRMVLFKYSRSLCLVKIPHYDMLIAVSEACFYNRAASKIGIKPKAKPLYFQDGAGLVIDLNSKGRITDNVKEFVLPIEHTDRYKTKHTEWMSSTSLID